MDENLLQTQYDVTKKSRLKKFYESNKIIIFSIILIIVITIVGLGFYLQIKEKEKIILSENYIKAKVYLENGNKSKAVDTLKTIIFKNNSTYSALSFFLILNENLITDTKELSNLFNHIIENNKFEKEIKNLMIFKKALFESNYVTETELLESVKPLINTETLWKPHALILLGDYFASRKEYLKAKEFYIQILSLEDINRELHDYARSQLIFIANE